MSLHCRAGRVKTLSVRRPQPHTTNPYKEENKEMVEDQEKKRIMITALKTRQSYNIEHMVIKRFLQRH